MLTNLLADETTTDNLLNNSKFTEDTDGWTLSDSNVRRDGNSYSDAGNSPTIRFKGQTSTISQLVSLTGVEQGKEIKSYTLKYNGYGCGNTATGWCTAGGDDTIVTNITFTDGTTTEISSHTIAVPYEDGWTHHTFTKSINDIFLTDNVAINFELSGIDTGNSSSWLGPITDNYELMVTYQDYIAPVVEPVVVEPIVIEPEVIEPIVVIKEIVVEESIIGGLELSTEITLDLIQDVPTLPSISGTVAEIPEIQPVAVIDISMPEINIEMPTPTEIPVDISGTIEVEPIQEIQEIVVEEPPQQPEMVETTDERREIEPEAESKIETVEAGTTNERSDIREPEPKEENKGEAKESTADANQSDKPKETTTVATTKTKESGDARTDSTKSKSKTKDNVQTDRPTSTAKKNTSRPKATLDVSTTKPQTIEQLPLPIAYLQIIQDSITIVETISLRQEQIYGGEQEYNLNTSSITIAGLDNNSSRRWNNLQNERKRFKAPKYSRRSKKD